MAKLLWSLAAIALLCPLVLAQTGTPADPELDRAKRLLHEIGVIDGHNDYPWAVREKANGNIDALDIRQPQPTLMTDIARLTAGGVAGQFWSVYVPVTLQGGEAVAATLDQIDIVHRMMAKYPTTFGLALTADDIERVQKGGRIASLIGVEGGHCINNSLGILRMFYQLGARYMTLTHNANTPWADAASDPPKNDGLNDFGESVIREMNRLGMMADLSHVSPATMADVLRVTTAPVIFSHSSARALTDVPRNVPDDILKLVKTNDGVVMVTFVPGFVSQEVADYNKRESDQQKAVTARLGADTAAITKAMDDWRKANESPRASLIQVANHIDHIKKIAGVDHIGLGGDFDGITSVVLGLEDVSTYPRLMAELLRRGYSDEDIRKIAGKNILRVMRKVEEVSKRTAK